MNGLVPNIEANTENMRAAAGQGFTTATDLADYLVGKGVPFRDAHEIVGQAVQLAVSSGKTLDELSLDELRGYHTQVIEEDVYQVLTLEGSVGSRDHAGGTAPSQVRKAIENARSTRLG